MWISEAAITTSDLRFKRDITPLNLELTKTGNNISATEALNALRPVAYTMTSDKISQSRRFGFIAQVCRNITTVLSFTLGAGKDLS